MKTALLRTRLHVFWLIPWWASCGCALFQSGDETENATGRVAFSGNLDAREPIPEAAWSAADPSGTARIAATVALSDANGVDQDLHFYFLKSEVSIFDYHVLVDGGRLEPSETGMVEIGSGRLYFDGTGALLDHEGIPLLLRFEGTSRDQEIELDFGSPLSEGKDGKDGFTQYALPTSINYHTGRL